MRSVRVIHHDKVKYYVREVEHWTTSSEVFNWLIATTRSSTICLGGPSRQGRDLPPRCHHRAHTPVSDLRNSSHDCTWLLTQSTWQGPAHGLREIKLLASCGWQMDLLWLLHLVPRSSPAIHSKRWSNWLSIGHRTWVLPHGVLLTSYTSDH